MDLFTPEKDIYTVSRLNREVAQLLQGSFPLLWLQGEISNFATPRSGHWYFSLKDQQAAVRAAMFRNKNQYLTFKPSEGMQVLVRARIGLYEPRGDYQLLIEHMEEAGEGALRRAFERLKQTLMAEGLFDPERKQALPELPKRIGVITSASGAAIRDVISVLKRRFPLIPVLIYPVLVQGEQAAAEIANSIALANQRRDCEVLLLVRGGGSLEDLQAFNEESVARAIAASKIPIVSGIGHEVDYTIADFVADMRAATPSAAAELISPNQTEWLNFLREQTNYLNDLLQDQLHNLQQRLSSLTRQLQLLHPLTQIQNQFQQVDFLENRLINLICMRLQNQRQALSQLISKLTLHSPKANILQLKSQQSMLCQRLLNSPKQWLSLPQQRLYNLMHTLDAVSPLATLKRGYAVVCNINNDVITDSKQVQKNDILSVRLDNGSLRVKVEQKEP